MPGPFNDSLPEFYSAWAEDYARRFGDELSYKPRDRELLQQVCHEAGHGPICDLGCGTGHIGAFLAAHGATVEGIDISPGMIAVARKRHPDIRFRLGNYFDLPAGPASYGAVVAFYSLIHAERTALPAALTEIARVLQPGGRLLAAFHEGDIAIANEGVIFNFFTRDEVARACETAVLEVTEIIARKSYPEENGDHDRLYLMARKPA